jgi:hypothetical protein
MIKDEIIPAPKPRQKKLRIHRLSDNYPYACHFNNYEPMLKIGISCHKRSLHLCAIYYHQ